MSRKRVTIQHRPIPEPPDKSLASSFCYMVASFFNNTSCLDIEHVDRNGRFGLRYRGYGHEDYNTHRRPRNRKRLKGYREC